MNEPDLITDLVAECERAMHQRDEFLRTGVSTSAIEGASHDTLFGYILQKHIPHWRSCEAVREAAEELLYLKDLEQWMSAPGTAGTRFYGRLFEAGEAAAEYRRRKPLAWQALRHALEE